MRCIGMVAVVTLLLAPALAEGQRRRRVPPPEAPVTLSLSTFEDGAMPFRRVLTVHASADVEVALDRRMLWLEVRAPGARRPLVCEHPDRPAAAVPLRSLSAGLSWSEWIDLREYCSGRARSALSGGAEVTAHLGRPTRRRGRSVVRWGMPSAEASELPRFTFTVPPVPPTPDPDPSSELRVVVADSDASNGRAVVVRVGVLGRRAGVRAYVRADGIRFSVRGPDGTSRCSMEPGGGAPTPDLFRTLRPAAGFQFTLDAAQYCGDAFRESGVYEVSATVELDQDGAAYGIDGVVGTFTSAPGVIRVRRGASGHVPRPVQAESRR